MNEKIANIFNIVKGNDIFYTDIWARMLIVVLYTDIFLGYIIPIFSLKINQLSDVVDGRFILLYIIFAMVAIILITLLTVFVHMTFALYIIPFITQYLFKDKVPTNTISAQSLKEFALLDNNDVAYYMSCDSTRAQEKLYYNAMIKIAMAILLIIDPFCGLYMNQLGGEIPSLSIIILFISLSIMIYQPFKYYYRQDMADRVYLSDVCMKKVKETLYNKSKL